MITAVGGGEARETRGGEAGKNDTMSPKKPESIESIESRVRKARLDLATLKDGAAAIAPGYVLSAEYSLRGTIKHVNYGKTRASVKAGGREIEGNATVRIIEDQSAHSEAQTLVSDAIALTDKLTAPYINGLKFAAPDDFAVIDDRLSLLREKAQDLNDAAISNGSQMRVKIEIYKFLIDDHDRRNAIRLAQLIYERLTKLREMYTDTRPNSYRIQLNNVTNLHKVVTGKQRELIERAIASTEDQRDRMIYNYGGKKYTLALRELYGEPSPNKKVPYDYEAIDMALAVFAPSLKYS